MCTFLVVVAAPSGYILVVFLGLVSITTSTQMTAPGGCRGSRRSRSTLWSNSVSEHARDLNSDLPEGQVLDSRGPDPL